MIQIVTMSRILGPESRVSGWDGGGCSGRTPIYPTSGGWAYPILFPENSNLLYGETREFLPPSHLYANSFLKNQKEHWGNLKITITLHYICASYRFSASFHAYLRPHSRRAEWAPFHCHRNVTEKKIQGVTPLNAISLWHAHAQKYSRLRSLLSVKHLVICF